MAKQLLESEEKETMLVALRNLSKTNFCEARERCCSVDFQFFEMPVVSELADGTYEQVGCRAEELSEGI